MTTANHRTADHEIDAMFLQRWSPRAFDGTPLTEEEVFRLVEAARWAPSAYNLQPWRFVFARRDTPAWERLLGLLLPFNAAWVAQAGALFVLASDTLMQPPGAEVPSPSHSHSFDAGAAWSAMSLQASLMGLQAHGMVGFDIPRTQVELGIPERFRIEAMIAVGHPADKSILPEKLAAREHPSARNPVESFTFEGVWRN